LSSKVNIITVTSFVVNKRKKNKLFWIMKNIYLG
jgi:hypothetical protein